MEFRGQKYNTLIEFEEADNLAHETLKVLNGYTSNAYSLSPIITTDNKFILVELKGFESELLEAGFEFVTLDKSIIKIEDL